MRRSAFFFILAVLVALVGVTAYEARLIARERPALDAARQRVDRLDAQLAELRPQRDRALRDLESATQKLAAPSTPAIGEGDAASAVALWLARVKRLKQAFDAQPGHRIPELNLLSDLDWVRLTRTLPLESEADLRQAMATLRSAGVEAFLKLLRRALEDYATTARGVPLSDLAQLAPCFPSPIDPAILPRYEITGEPRGDPREDLRMISERAPIDEEMDFRHSVSVRGDSTGYVPWAAQVLSQAQDDARRAFKAAHSGREPTKPWEILPYVSDPAVKALWEAMAAYEKSHYGQQSLTPVEVRPYVKDPAALALLEKLIAAQRPGPER